MGRTKIRRRHKLFTCKWGSRFLCSMCYTKRFCMMANLQKIMFYVSPRFRSLACPCHGTVTPSHHLNLDVPALSHVAALKTLSELRML